MGSDTLIRDGEQLEELQLGGLKILQKTDGFRFGMDAVLLADFARIAPKSHVVDLGTGTGILPLLLIGRGKGARFDAFEVQADMADMAKRTMALNGLAHCVTVHPNSVNVANAVIAPCTVDAVVCNPPYGIPGTTVPNAKESLSLARHQDETGLSAWFSASYRMLRGRGKMFMIYPTAGMNLVFTQLQEAHLMPKRIRLIYSTAEKPSRLVMIEAMRDAKSGLTVDAPLILARADGQMTDEVARIYHMDAMD